jgi:hypothetical protein
MQSLCEMPTEYMGVFCVERTPVDSWLARNALLLKSFEFWPGRAAEEDGDETDIDETIGDELIAEGFAKAAAAAADVAADAYAAAADSNSDEPPGAAAPLPLQRLVCGAPSASNLLGSLAGITPHLTSLCLCAADIRRVTFDDFLGCLDALGALTSLQELTLAHGAPPGSEYVPACYNVHLHSLPHLTQLTVLDLAPVRRGWPDAPNPWQEAAGLHMRALPSFPEPDQQVDKLPPSLVDLAVAFDVDSGPIDLRHMTAVTQLYVGGLRQGDFLPPGVKHLQLHDSRSLQPVLEGCSQHLRELRLDFETIVCELPAGFHQQLSQLNALHIRMHLDGSLPGDPVGNPVGSSWLKGWVQGCGQLQDLPCLHSLVLHWQSKYGLRLTSPAVAAFASCTQLTRLSLWQNMLGDGDAVLELAPRLARMHTLQQLHLGGLGGADVAAWRQVCAAVAKLPALREVELERCRVSKAARKLAAATQLTRLVLEDCGVDAATKAALAAGLESLPQQSTRSCTGRALVLI